MAAEINFSENDKTNSGSVDDKREKDKDDKKSKIIPPIIRSDIIKGAEDDSKLSIADTLSEIAASLNEKKPEDEVAEVDLPPVIQEEPLAHEQDVLATENYYDVPPELIPLDETGAEGSIHDHEPDSLPLAETASLKAYTEAEIDEDDEPELIKTVSNEMVEPSRQEKQDNSAAVNNVDQRIEPALGSQEEVLPHELPQSETPRVLERPLETIYPPIAERQEPQPSEPEVPANPAFLYPPRQEVIRKSSHTVEQIVNPPKAYTEQLRRQIATQKEQIDNLNHNQELGRQDLRELKQQNDLLIERLIRNPDLSQLKAPELKVPALEKTRRPRRTKLPVAAVPTSLKENQGLESILPDNHRLERSAWHAIEVDSGSGHVAEKPSFDYGAEFNREQRQETLPPPVPISPDSDEEIAVASGQLAVGTIADFTSVKPLSAQEPYPDTPNPVATPLHEEFQPSFVGMWLWIILVIIVVVDVIAILA